MPGAGRYLKMFGFSPLRGLFRRMHIPGTFIETVPSEHGACLKYKKNGKNIGDYIETIWNPSTKAVEKKIVVKNDYLFLDGKGIQTVKTETDQHNKIVSIWKDMFEKTHGGKRPICSIHEDHSVEPPIITTRSYDYSTGVPAWCEVKMQGKNIIENRCSHQNLNNGMNTTTRIEHQI